MILVNIKFKIQKFPTSIALMQVWMKCLPRIALQDTRENSKIKQSTTKLSVCSIQKEIKTMYRHYYKAAQCPNQFSLCSKVWSSGTDTMVLHLDTVKILNVGRRGREWNVLECYLSVLIKSSSHLCTAVQTALRRWRPVLRYWLWQTEETVVWSDIQKIFALGKRRKICIPT